MKGLEEIRVSVSELLVGINNVKLGKVSKEQLGERLSHIIATLEVFTDLNYNEQEQAIIFQRSGQQIETIRRMPDVTITGPGFPLTPEE